MTATARQAEGVTAGPRRADWAFWERGKPVPWREYIARTGTR